MFDPVRSALESGAAVEVDDLGDWDALRVVAEYDPAAAVIRVNERALVAFRAAVGRADEAAVRAFVDLAVAHELYHHREALGLVTRWASRVRREAAADAYARAHVSVDARIDAFLAAARTAGSTRVAH